jgi:hypothetical protein
MFFYISRKWSHHFKTFVFVSAHGMAYALVFAYCLPQSILIPMFLEKHKLYKLPVDLALKVLTCVVSRHLNN